MSIKVGMSHTKDEKKQLIIDPEGAEVVKRIYREYLEGASLFNICKGLEADGILTGAGLPKWRPETVKKMLQNEKHVGDALLQKTYTIDFLEKKRVINNEIVPQYYVENSHEAIIPRDLHMQVQEELKRRVNLYNSKNGGKRIYSSKYALSSIAFCGECGGRYIAEFIGTTEARNRLCGDALIAWRKRVVTACHRQYQRKFCKQE